jgi:hypothetical protein
VSWNTEARWLAKAGAFSALLCAHVPCGIRICIEGWLSVFNILVVSGSLGCETLKKLLDVGIFVLM